MGAVLNLYGELKSVGKYHSTDVDCRSSNRGPVPEDGVLSGFPPSSCWKMLNYVLLPYRFVPIGLVHEVKNRFLVPP